MSNNGRPRSKPMPGYRGGHQLPPQGLELAQTDSSKTLLARARAEYRVTELYLHLRSTPVSDISITALHYAVRQLTRALRDLEFQAGSSYRWSEECVSVSTALQGLAKVRADSDAASASEINKRGAADITNALVQSLCKYYGIQRKGK